MKTRHGIVEISYDGEFTLAVLSAEGKPTVLDYSRCSKQDNFDRRVGRKIAISRVLAKSGLTRRQRQEVWEDLWELGMRR
jgi:hypothetical protein